jgi:acyl-CoA thioesterase-1
MFSRTPHVVAAVSAATIAILVLSAGTASVASHPTIVQHSIVASPTGPVVVAIGDSIMEGHGLSSDQAWLALLARENGWRFTNLASDGSGFVTAGNDGDTFADQASTAESLHPDVIILAGSSNDLGADGTAIDEAATATIADLHTALPTATIIAVNSIWGDSAVPVQMSAIDAGVDTATAAVGGIFVNIGQPLAGQPTLMQADDVHPTAGGQEILAAAVNRELAKVRSAL